MPFFDPIADQHAKSKRKPTRRKSPYDVIRSERPDLLPDFEQLAKDKYPDDSDAQRGHINTLYSEEVKKDKHYWERRANEVNDKAEKDANKNDDRLPRSK